MSLSSLGGSGASPIGECASSIGTERPGACLLTRCFTTAPIQHGAVT